MTTEILIGAIVFLFGSLVTLAGLYRALSTKKADELAALNLLLAQAGESHRTTISRLEGEKDKVERELRDLYERMLDAAYSVRRSGPPRPHRGREVETLDERRERLVNVTGAFSDADRREYARRLATGPIVHEPDPPTL